MRTNFSTKTMNTLFIENLTSNEQQKYQRAGA